MEWHGLKGYNIYAVIKKLNPILRGWGNYYNKVVSSATFIKLDHFNHLRSLKWGMWTHPKKSTEWIKRTYFGRLDKFSQNKWRFGDSKTRIQLFSLGTMPIKRHILVRHGASPDNPAESKYWQQREKRKVELLPTQRHKQVAKKQDGICDVCGDSLYGVEEIHLHHDIPKSEGGSDTTDNLRLLHGICHRQQHKSKSGQGAQRTRTDQARPTPLQVAETPCPP